jgi:hypothetical protein
LPLGCGSAGALLLRWRRGSCRGTSPLLCTAGRWPHRTAGLLGLDPLACACFGSSIQSPGPGPLTPAVVPGRPPASVGRQRQRPADLGRRQLGGACAALRGAHGGGQGHCLVRGRAVGSGRMICTADRCTCASLRPLSGAPDEARRPPFDLAAPAPRRPTPPTPLRRRPAAPPPLPPGPRTSTASSRAAAARRTAASAFGTRPRARPSAASTPAARQGGALAGAPASGPQRRCPAAGAPAGPRAASRRPALGGPLREGPGWSRIPFMPPLPPSPLTPPPAPPPLPSPPAPLAGVQSGVVQERQRDRVGAWLQPEPGVSLGPACAAHSPWPLWHKGPPTAFAPVTLGPPTASAPAGAACGSRGGSGGFGVGGDGGARAVNARAGPAVRSGRGSWLAAPRWLAPAPLMQHSGPPRASKVVVWKYPSMTKLATLTGHTFRWACAAPARKMDRSRPPACALARAPSDPRRRAASASTLNTLACLHLADFHHHPHHPHLTPPRPGCCTWRSPRTARPS